MLAGCWFCTTIPTLKAQIIGWAGLILFGLGLIAMLVQVCRSGPSVILDDGGIHDLRSSFGAIPWSDIVSLRIGSIKDQRFLCVEVIDPSVYLSRLPSYKRVISESNRLFGFPPITIGFNGL